MDIWVVRTSNQYFLICSYTETNFFKKSKVATGKTLFFVIGPCRTPHSICLNIGFRQGKLPFQS